MKKRVPMRSHWAQQSTSGEKAQSWRSGLRSLEFLDGSGLMETKFPAGWSRVGGN